MAKGKKGKKGKKDKKGKKSKKSKGGPDEDEGPDPNVVCREGEFTLPNGDIYIGEFCAHKQGLIWREGHGIYTTKDGQVYEGLWHDDKLAEGVPVEIHYPEGHIFVGLIANDKYNGAGAYYCEDVVISCNFENNRPKGPIALVDPKGEVYSGDARDHSATLLPPNVLFNNINPSRGILYDETTINEMMDIESGLTFQMSDAALKIGEPPTQVPWKDLVFAKSKKTDSRMFFDESRWYKDWLSFKKTKKRIRDGTSSANDGDGEHSQSSSFNDEQWLREYELYKRVRHTSKTRAPSSAVTLAQDIDGQNLFSAALIADNCPTVRVLYPTTSWATFDSALDYDEMEGSTPGPNDLETENGRKSSGNVPVTQRAENIRKSLESVPVARASGQLEDLKPTRIQEGLKTTSKRQCYNRKNFGGTTNSLFHLVNNYFNNKPIN